MEAQRVVSSAISSKVSFWGASGGSFSNKRWVFKSIEVRGLLISWATPAAIFPKEASLAD